MLEHRPGRLRVREWLKDMTMTNEKQVGTGGRWQELREAIERTIEVEYADDREAAVDAAHTIARELEQQTAALLEALEVVSRHMRGYGTATQSEIHRDFVLPALELAKGGQQ